MSEEAKREIVGACLQKGVLINKEILLKINGIQDITGFKRHLDDKLLTGTELSQETFLQLITDYMQPSKPDTIQDTTPDMTPDTGLFSGVTQGTVDVVFSYEIEPKKRTVKDFLGYFTSRYNTLRPILQSRTEMKNLTSINRLRQRTERGEVSIIGLVADKQMTKTGKIIFNIEDPTGQVKVMVSPDKDCFTTAKDCVFDEIVGVVGNTGDGIIFANNLLVPDIPLYKELKKSPDEAYALFIGDFHFGSNVFLKEPFERFINWLRGDCSETYQEVMKKLKYIFLVGDLVEGVGIYPGQENDLLVKDIYDQYKEMAEYLARIPKHIQIIICPGNHDAMRIAEPQPPLYKDFAEAVWALPNVVMVSNPAYVNIHKQEGFPGFDVLLYHGFSFPYYADKVESIRSAGGQERVDKIMEFLLKRRHLAPEHKSTLYLPDHDKDSLVIDKIPDIFATGHIHKVSASNYRNITLLNCSSWLRTTEYQEKLGIVPHPGKAILMNLQTRKVKILKFYDEEKEKETASQAELRDAAEDAKEGAQEGT